MSGSTTSPSGIQTRPIAAAGGVVVAVQAVMAALWAVVGDAGLLPWLTPGSQGLITFAITAIATVLGAYWASNRSTSTSSPTLQAGTSVRVTDEAGATLGHAPVQTPSDPDA
jgi:hypothetical protein